MQILDAAATAAVLPWGPLAQAIADTLADQAAGRVQAPDRWVLPVAPGTSWFLMPAWVTPEAGPRDAARLPAEGAVSPWGRPGGTDADDLAAIKLITYSAQNPARGLPAILGDVLVMRASTGQRLLLLDGPTVTARRTAAATLLAAQRLAPNPAGPLLAIGTGVQALSHVQAFAEGLGVRQVQVIGRTPERAAAFAAELGGGAGVQAEAATDLGAALADCPLVITATPASGVVLRGTVRPDAFVAAIGAFTPQMIELDPALTRGIAAHGTVVLDSPAARHEAGDLIAAGLALDTLPTLGDAPGARTDGPVLFKSCGAALWDLAAARCAAALAPQPG